MLSSGQALTLIYLVNNFSCNNDTLMNYLTLLGCNVEIKVRYINSWYLTLSKKELNWTLAIGGN
jgi:hypothetical protein